MTWFKKEVSPDEVLAAEIRRAAHCYNEAVKAAKKAGLSVSANVVSSSYSGPNTTWIWDQVFQDIGIRRNATVRL